MKKLPIITFLLLIIVILIPSQLNNLNLYQKEKREWREVSDYGPFYFYNGTRYPYVNFKDVFITEENDEFNINFKISFEDLFDTIIIKYSNSEYHFEPYVIINDTGFYDIDNLIVKPNHYIGEYPYDIFYYNISLWTINDTYGKPMINYLTKDYSSDEWNIKIKGEWNKLFFTFKRTSEISTYNGIRTIYPPLMIFFLIVIIFVLFSYNYGVAENTFNKIYDIVKAIGFAIITTFIIPLIYNIISFQYYNYLSSEHVQNLIFNGIVLICFILIFILFIKIFMKKSQRN